MSIPHTITISSSQQGFIIQRKVSAGERVIAGQPLYAINVSRSTTFGVVGQRQHQDIESQIQTTDKIIARTLENKRVTLEALSRQKAHYQQALDHANIIIKEAQKGLGVMKTNMENYQHYRQKGLINNDQLTNQSTVYYQQQNDLLTLTAQNEQNTLQILMLEGSLRTQSTDFDNEILKLGIQKHELQRQLTDIDAADTVIVTSPVAGRVDSVSVTDGQMVSGGDSLLQIIPGNVSSYELVLWVPDSAIPWLRQGEKINIRYDAYPSEKFGQFPGTISGISLTPASAQEMASYPAAPRPDPGSPHTWYKVLVRPDISGFHWQGQQLLPENGMKATCTLFLEERKLYQWLLSPLYQIRESAGGQVNGK
ncbi:HlyD family secretion protein [Erwinia sorbitola]|uniref:HlyD family secretion protein n=1 Tax=Erwinia sorbitola TaxID=2681984 RepID=UPI001E2E03FF|nr:HlyD family secretion protein [Erwinia sorbitola]